MLTENNINQIIPSHALTLVLAYNLIAIADQEWCLFYEGAQLFKMIGSLGG